MIFSSGEPFSPSYPDICRVFSPINILYGHCLVFWTVGEAFYDYLVPFQTPYAFPPLFIKNSCNKLKMSQTFSRILLKNYKNKFLRCKHNIYWLLPFQIFVLLEKNEFFTSGERGKSAVQAFHLLIIFSIE